MYVGLHGQVDLVMHCTYVCLFACGWHSFVFCDIWHVSCPCGLARELSVQIDVDVLSYSHSDDWASSSAYGVLIRFVPHESLLLDYHGKCAHRFVIRGIGNAGFLVKSLSIYHAYWFMHSCWCILYKCCICAYLIMQFLCFVTVMYLNCMGLWK